MVGAAQLPAAPTRRFGGQIAAQIRALFAPRPAAAAQGAVLPGAALLGVASRAAAAAPVFPSLKTGEVISFTLPSLGHETALLSGWNLVDSSGAALERAIGVVSFEWQGALPETELELELLLSARNLAKPGAPAPADTQIMLNLNGVELGLLTLGGKGVKRYSLSVPSQAWTRRGAQVLVLARQGDIKDLKAQAQVALLSLAVSPPRQPGPDWASFAASSQTLAPLCDVDPLVFFQKDAKPGFASLGRGWALAETTGIWNNGSSAAVVFEPPLQNNTPSVLALVGHSLRRDASGLQRVPLAMGATAIAEVMLGGDAAAVTELALPATLTQQGMDHLLLHFPDAVSPAELGLGEDFRLLGLHLIGMEQIRTTTRSYHHSRAEAGASLPNRLKILPGVLRLTGAAALPPGACFHLSGTNVLAQTLPCPNGGWECCLRLSPAHLSEPGLLLSLLDGACTLEAAAVVDSVEIWAEAGPADREPVEVALWLAEPGPTELGLAEDVEPSGGGPNPGGADLRLWLGQDRARLRQMQERAPLHLPFAMDMGSTGTEMPIFVAGWAASEPEMTWSQDKQAVLGFGGVLAADDYMLRLQMGALIVPPHHAAQRIGVIIDGHRRATIATLRPEPLERQLAFTTRKTQKLTLLFELPDAVSPAAIGLSSDERLLGLRLHHMALDQLEPPCTKPEGAPRDGILRVNWHDADDAPDWALTLLAAATSAPVLDLSASGPAPFGLSLGESDLVVHPVVVEGPDGNSDWRALLVVPPELLHQTAGVEGIASGVLPMWLYAADDIGQLDLQSRRPGPAVTITF